MRWRRYFIDTILALGGAFLLSSIIAIFHLYPAIPTISLTYLLIVLVLASTRGLYAAILASLVAFFSFDFFLVPPLYTFAVSKSEDLLALFVFLATAIITGQLASALRARVQQANRREHETRILYELVRATNSEEDVERQLNIIAHAIVDVFSSWGVHDCAVLLSNAEGKLIGQVGRPTSDALTLSPDEQATAEWVLREAQTVDLHEGDTSVTKASIGHTARVIVQSYAHEHAARRYIRLIPLKMGRKVIGLLRLLIDERNPGLFTPQTRLGVGQERSDPQTAFFGAFLDQAVSVIERGRLRRENLQVEVLQRTDVLRAALLSSVSHDLRTPLSTIKAAASSLLQEDVQWDEEARRSFVIAIERESDRLNRLVGNLLDMSRIEGGALHPEKEWYPIDELIHDVLDRVQSWLQERRVQTSIPDDLPPVKLDYLQIDQVLTNLIENVVRYTPAGSPIDIGVEVEDEQMVVSVADHGAGISATDCEHIFDKFYRVPGTQCNMGSSVGSGLGLAVCRGLIEAHGGRIWAEQREDEETEGTVLRFTLPLNNTEEIPS